MQVLYILSSFHSLFYKERNDNRFSISIHTLLQVTHYKLYIRDTKEHAIATSTSFTQTLGSCADMYLYRLAEVYLLRAEARFFQDNNQGATEDVNTIRRRAKASQYYTSVTIGDIMNERARELYLEEWRNVELKRVSYELAKSGKPDEWGNTYSLDNWDKQEGTDEQGVATGISDSCITLSTIREPSFQMLRL